MGTTSCELYILVNIESALRPTVVALRGEAALGCARLQPPESVLKHSISTKGSEAAGP